MTYWHDGVGAVRMFLRSAAASEAAAEPREEIAGCSSYVKCRYIAMSKHSAVRAYLHLHCTALHPHGRVALVGLDGPIAFYFLLRSSAF